MLQCGLHLLRNSVVYGSRVGHGDSLEISVDRV
jgi:hypothetical protein